MNQKGLLLMSQVELKRVEYLEKLSNRQISQKKKGKKGSGLNKLSYYPESFGGTF